MRSGIFVAARYTGVTFSIDVEGYDLQETNRVPRSFETFLAIGNGRISWLDDQDLWDILWYIMIYIYIMLGICIYTVDLKDYGY